MAGENQVWSEEMLVVALELPPSHCVDLQHVASSLSAVFSFTGENWAIQIILDISALKFSRVVPIVNIKKMLLPDIIKRRGPCDSLWTHSPQDDPRELGRAYYKCAVHFFLNKQLSDTSWVLGLNINKL